MKARTASPAAYAEDVAARWWAAFLAETGFDFDSPERARMKARTHRLSSLRRASAARVTGEE